MRHAVCPGGAPPPPGPRRGAKAHRGPLLPRPGLPAEGTEPRGRGAADGAPGARTAPSHRRPDRPRVEGDPRRPAVGRGEALRGGEPGGRDRMGTGPARGGARPAGVRGGAARAHLLAPVLVSPPLPFPVGGHPACPSVPPPV